MGRNMSVKELLSIVNTKMLDDVAASTDVNFQVKKLSGQVIFKLLLLAILDDTKVSLRVMEELFRRTALKYLPKQILMKAPALTASLTGFHTLMLPSSQQSLNKPFYCANLN